MTTDETHLKHLEWIQNIITRQANNSFLLKGWSITLVAAMFALAAKDSDRSFLWLAWLPVIAFGLLDAFYLHKEKQFIALFDWVQKGKTTETQIGEHGPFCLNPVGLISHDDLPRVTESFNSPSIWGFYAPLLAASLLIPIWLSQPTSSKISSTEKPKTEGRKQFIQRENLPSHPTPLGKTQIERH